MAMKCQICGKGRISGHNISFSQRKTKRDFKPNLQSKRVYIGSNSLKLKICTQCLKRLKQSGNLDQVKSKPAAAKAK